MNKNVFLSVAAALMLAACSNDDQLPPEETPIRLSAGLDVAAGTRGITDNSYKATVFNGGETIDVNIVETGSPASPSVTYGTSGWLTATIGASGDGATLSSACYWPGSGAGIDIYAWYPVSTATTYWTTAHSVFKVPATQSGNTDHKAFDLMYAAPVGGEGTNSQTVPSTSRTSAINLQFTHKLAKLVVTLAPKDASSGVTIDDLKNATVTIGSVQTTADVTAATGVVAASGTADTETLTIMANEAGVTGYALIPAQTLSGTLSVTLKAGGAMTTTLSGFAVLAGQTNTLNVSVSLTDITVTTSIVNWTPNDNAGTADLKL